MKLRVSVSRDAALKHQLNRPGKIDIPLIDGLCLKKFTYREVPMKNRNSYKQVIALVCALAVLASSSVYTLAQKSAPAKRALSHQDYDSWRSIQSPQISRDGKFVAYAYMAQDGDSEIVVRSLANSKEWRAARGYRPPTPPPDDAIPNLGEIIAAQARLVRPVFTADSRFVVFSIEPAKAELAKATKEKKKPEDMPSPASAS